MTEDKEITELLESIRFTYGYDFTDYARASVRRRIDHFMSKFGIRDIADLGTALLRDEQFFEQFVQEFTVNVTEMFRDPDFYKALREKVARRLATYPFIKVWVAGCATGEEVYSLAILLREENLLDRSILYATDINQKSLLAAKEGVFSMGEMKTYTDNYIKAGGKTSFSDYFVARYGAVLIDASLRRNIVFAPHNLAVDRSFNEFQLILCRNVLIYFNQELQRKVIDLFYDSLCTFGFLALGNKESLLFSRRKDKFAETDRRERIFMKKP